MPKEESLHVNKIPTSLKNKLKKIAEKEERSLEKQVVFALKEFVDSWRKNDG